MKDIEPIIKKDIKTLMLAVAMTALVASKAWSADGVMLNTDITLTGDVLTVGDVFTGAAADADHVLAPAPAPGKSMTLTANDLKRISDAFNLGWSSDRPAQAVVHRDGQEVDQYTIQALVAARLQKDMDKQKFDVALDNPTLSLPLSNEAAASLAVGDIKYDIANGSFKALLTANQADGAVFRKEVTGKLTTLTSVPVLSHAMNQGDVITAADIQYIDMKSDALASSLIVDPAKLVGQTPRRMVPAMRPMAANDITLPPAVLKGQVVTMTLKSGKLQLTAQGKALDSASVGDVVRVVNTASQQIIQAVVTGDRVVEVGGPDGALGTI